MLGFFQIPKNPESKDFSEEINISTLFLEFGIKKESKVFINKNTYPIDERDVKNSWIYVAFKGFKKYKNLGKKVNVFASIGTGAGIDGIGANEILRPKEIILTDIHENVLPIAKINFLNNIENYAPKKFAVLKGDLCEPLKKHKIKPDLIYANLPNIPFEQKNILDSIKTSSFFESRKNVPLKFEKHLLALQYSFLKEAKENLVENGAVLLNLGQRVPKEIIADLFSETGFKAQKFVNAFKLQTEADEVLNGYSAAEKKYGVEFDFFLFENPSKRVNASQALRLHNKGVKIAHKVTLFLAWVG